MLKPLGYSQGFTLVELLAVALIVAVISIGVSSRFSDQSTFQTLTTRDDIVAGLFYAQQIAIARDSDTNNVQFVSTGSSIDIRENGVSIGNGIYPLALPGTATLTSVTLDYDKLGRTSATSLSLTDGGASATIQVSASGYAN